MSTRPRRCYYVDEAMNPDGKGFIPALVVEGEPGYRPMGDPNSDGVRAPWPHRWGNTFEEAKRIVDEKNAQLGISHDDMMDIVGSSMFPAWRGRKRR